MKIKYLLSIIAVYLFFCSGCAHLLGVSTEDISREIEKYGSGLQSASDTLANVAEKNDSLRERIESFGLDLDQLRAEGAAAMTPTQQAEFIATFAGEKLKEIAANAMETAVLSGGDLGKVAENVKAEGLSAAEQIGILISAILGAMGMAKGAALAWNRVPPGYTKRRAA